MRLDGAAPSLEKLVVKALKHAAWFVIALWTAYTFVGYFSPIRDLGIRAITWQLGPWEAFWILFYGLATYGNAGFMREQVCKYMCPYARFQSAMFDRDTLIIAYDRERGEPRGPRSRKVGRQGERPRRLRRLQHLRPGLPDRHRHPQGAAVRMHRLRGVHRRLRPGDGQDGLPEGTDPLRVGERAGAALRPAAMWKRMLRPRTLIYTGLLAVIVVATGASLGLRNPLKVDVIRDRGALAREAAPGVIENVYRVQIMNTDETPRRFTIAAEGLPDLKVVGVEQPVAVGAAGTRLVPVRLQVPVEAGKPGSNGIEFVVQSTDDPTLVRREKSTFMLPR